jgi:hypothetical protein
MKAVNVSRAKAFECLSLAECMNNPEERAEMPGVPMSLKQE